MHEPRLGSTWARIGVFEQRTALPLRCEVVELGLLVYSVAMSWVRLCTYQGCSMTVWSDDDEEEAEVAEEDDDDDERSIIYTKSEFRYLRSHY